jgi:hypothetical protein
MAALYNNGFMCRALSLATAGVVANTVVKAVDVTLGNGFSAQFEVTSAIATAAQVEFWAVPATVGSPTVPNLAGAYQITEVDLCDITGASLVVDAVNVPVGTPVGTVVWARPRSFPERFFGVKGVAGDFAHLSPVAVFDRLK